MVTQTLVLRFRIEGRLVWLSHREMATLWQRALVRAGVPLVYSEGFSPHPRLSLPLPRSVGLAAEDEMLCARVEGLDSPAPPPLRQTLERELPEGCTLTGMEVAAGRVTFEAVAADYVISLGPAISRDRTRQAVERLREHVARSEPIPVLRSTPGKGRPRERDVAPFLASVTYTPDHIEMTYRIRPEGTVRLDEIFDLLELTPADLSGPAVRTRVQWIRKDKSGNDG